MQHNGILWLSILAFVGGCGDASREPAVPLAEGIFGPLGTVRPNATADEKAQFEKGEAIAKRRFSPSEGLGPLFNVTFCGACHEKPVFGGAAGRYRDFFLHGQTTDGGFIASGDRSGILSAYRWPIDEVRPIPDETANTFSVRNPIPFFGIGLLAEVPEESIMRYADPEDADGDGISGRPNYDRGFVGRFGTKAQTVSVEGFIRGPLFNHLGITTDPLSNDLKARLPVPSTVDGEDPRLETSQGNLSTRRFHQAAAPSEPLTDDDDIADPEMDEETLFSLVSWAMLLAAPQPDEPTAETTKGYQHFDDLGCTGCHVPALEGPRGMIPAYSDLLLHDMGDDLADGVSMGLATGNEFRTAPLWGITAVGPYLHDGRADTLHQAIVMHGGEAKKSRDRYIALDASAQAELIAFLNSLGGSSQKTAGLILPDTEVPAVGELGGPLYPLPNDDAELFNAGRALFDRDLFLEDGLGPQFSGDSCRACHFDPIPGGAGPLGVNGTRYGRYDGDTFVEPEGGTVLAKLALSGHRRPEPAVGMMTESRQTPPVFGVGILDRISPEAILANADPMDTDGDGISGRAHVFVDGRVGRFGWKAQIPSLVEFVRDAVSVEFGVTVPMLVLLDDGGRDITPEYTFGRSSDDDDIADPEISAVTLDTLTFYISQLAPPRPKAEVENGRRLFEFIGCADCHTPRLTGMEGDVAAYTDLLLHEILPDDQFAVPDGEARAREYRTPPLWGLSSTAPYMHDGSAPTVHAAIIAHGGEAQNTVDRYEALTEAERAPLLEFLENL